MAHKIVVSVIQYCLIAVGRDYNVVKDEIIVCAAILWDTRVCACTEKPYAMTSVGEYKRVIDNDAWA